MPIEDLVNHFLLDQLSQGRDPHLIEQRRNTLHSLVAWQRAEGHADDPETWTPALLHGFIAHHQQRARAADQPISATSVHSITLTLRAFDRWLKEIGEITRAAL